MVPQPRPRPNPVVAAVVQHAKWARERFERELTKLLVELHDAPAVLHEGGPTDHQADGDDEQGDEGGG